MRVGGGNVDNSGHIDTDVWAGRCVMDGEGWGEGGNVDNSGNKCINKLRNNLVSKIFNELCSKRQSY